MEHVERVLRVLNHREPDRVPIDLGGAVSGIHHIALRNLLSFMGQPNPTVTIRDRMQGLADIPESLLRHFDVDIRHVHLNPPRLDEIKYISEDRYIDEYGILFERHGNYFEIIEAESPLYNAETPKDVEKYVPPKPHEGRLRDLGKTARRYHEEGYAVMMENFAGGLWELTQWLHGFSNSFRDVILNPELIDAILDMILEMYKEFWAAILNEVGDYIHIARFGDDYGFQTGPQLAPKQWERFIFPRLRELVHHIKKHAKVKVMLHSCGGIRPLIEKIIEAGVDILNPLQPRAKGMDRRELKKEFGGRLIFHGGVDIQYVLPRGSMEEVEAEVRDVIEVYAPGGEYIFAPAHNIQADVPPQNIITAYRTALTHDIFGRR